MSDTIGVISLGCSKNLVDTENMLGQLKEAGFSFTSEPKEADILIVNTCGFIETAKQESIDAILDMASYKKIGKCRTLVVTGCLSERYRTELNAEIPEIDILLGVREYERLPALLLGREWKTTHSERVLTTPNYSAYLRIADGCSNRCSYCAIPAIRGPYKSDHIERLVEEAKRLSENGVSEITLIAQDTSGYGKDLYSRFKLDELISRLSLIDGLKWIRVLYTYPDDLTPPRIDLLAENEKLCRYLDMPIQHINDEILSRMNRRGTRAHIEGLLDYVRAKYPDFVLRTTVMVGFPGETDAQFDELLSFLRDHPFDRLGAFAFSPEDGTAAEHMSNQIPEDVKLTRLSAVMKQQQEISLSLNEARVGREVETLITAVEGKTALARSYAEAPEVDGVVKIPFKEGYSPGIYTRVKLIRAGIYDMEGIEV